MNNNVLRRGIGVGVGVALLATGFAVTRDDADHQNAIKVTVADAGQLEKGAEVRASGVRIGEVSDIELTEGKALLTLHVSPTVLPLHDDASIKIRPVNLLGENFIDLDPGSDSRPFARDTVIPESRASSAVTLQDLLNTFEDPTAAGLASVVTTLGEGFDGNGAELAKALKLLSGAMHDSERVGQILSEQNDILASLVESTDPVVGALAADDGQRLDSLVESTRDTLASLENQQVALEQTIEELPATLASAERTLASFGDTARAGAPTLRALRPLTGDLEQVVAELRNFADSADPALASLKPVLKEAERLLEIAAPVVAQLRQAGPDLATTASKLKPASRELLDVHLQDVMDFVRKWALSTNGRDGLSHYFRGVVYVTPTTLQSFADSLVPVGTAAPGSASPDVPSGPTGSVDDLLGALGDQSKKSTRSAEDPASALGLTAQQEENLLSQFLGGNQ
ncbi:MlaD family protein [Nocardioides sp. NPDC051685]|uniref:MlaD family protein n=1 Tax=Nocardioides sp. NPDC051685 TaxID=3364334 RepID=UPI00379955AB